MSLARWKQAQYASDHYRRNSERMKARAIEATARQRAKLRAFVVEIKEQGCCADCGTSQSAHAMDFDHVRGVKRDAVANLVRVPVSLRTLKEEIAKCELVCANCHRGRTQSRLGAAIEQPANDDGALRLFD